MGQASLTIACSDYDHVRDLATGRVRIEGVDPIFLDLPVEEIFFRFTKYREWDVSEMSMGKYVNLRSRGDDSLTAIPVFPSRVFRHSSLYVRTDSELEDPADLADKRVGLPEWAQTASVYSRGLLMHEYGVDLRTIQWFQAGVNQPGRIEKVPLQLPDGVTYEPLPERTLDDLLLAGDVDAVMTAHAPASFEAGDGRVRRLMRDSRAAEEAYYRSTGIFPIMHTVAIRRDVVDRWPWVAQELYKAFEEAKQRSVARAREMTASRFPVPWIPEYAARAMSIFGEDPLPYGLKANRRTLDAFLSFAAEQGVAHGVLTADELFEPTTFESFRI